MKVPVGSRISISSLKKSTLFKKCPEQTEAWQATKRSEILVCDACAEAFDREFSTFR
jgi:hypothetical protein